MPSVKEILKTIGKQYIASIEEAIGGELKPENEGLRFSYEALFSSIEVFYETWSLRSEKETQLFWDEADGRPTPCEISDEIQSPVRDQIAEKATPGIYLLFQIDQQVEIKSTLMFADAILFWDPFELILADNQGSKSGFDVELTLGLLYGLRDLILEGLVVPAQVRASRIGLGNGILLHSQFEVPLMIQGALGLKAFNDRVTTSSNSDLTIKADLEEMKGYRGHAENKFVQMMMPDIAVPMMDQGIREEYLDFCSNLEKPALWREIEYFTRSLSFESGFVIDGTKLDGKQLIELRKNDSIFEAFRSAITDAVEDYEKALKEGYSVNFITEFNIRIADEFKKLKAAGTVSNIWKYYIDESKSFSKKIVAKVSEHPFDPGSILHDVQDHFGDIARPSIVNLVAGCLKTYTRYRNTKLFLEVAACIRDNAGGREHSDE